MSACRKCSECDGGHHALGVLEDENGIPCKHCDAVGEYCDCYDEFGDGEPTNCAKCGGTGILWKDSGDASD